MSKIAWIDEEFCSKSSVGGWIAMNVYVVGEDGPSPTWTAEVSGRVRLLQKQGIATREQAKADCEAKLRDALVEIITAIY